MARQSPTFRQRLASTNLLGWKPFSATSYGQPPYEGAAGQRRLANWITTRSGPNALLVSFGDELRSRARDLARNNSYAASAIESLVANLVGTGIKPQSLCPDPRLKKEIQEAWNRFSDECDASGTTDFYGLQALAVREMKEAGECFVRFRNRREGDGLLVPLQLQLIESEQLPLEKNESYSSTTSVIRAGIQFNGIGQRTSYHFYREHPGESALFASYGDTIPVPASQIIHLFEPLRAGQVRGETSLTAAMVDLHEIDQYEDSEMARKKTAAMFAGFITQLSEDTPIVPQGGDAAFAGPQSPGAQAVSLEPGTLQVMLPGEDIKFSQPSDVGQSYEPFLYHALSKVAAGLGLPYHQLNGDLTKVNFSSIRAGTIEFHRRCEQFQWAVIIYQLCRSVWKQFLYQAVLAGALPPETSSPENSAVTWRTPRWDWVDPLKDMQAQVMAVENGFTSRGEVINSLGEDEEAVDDAIKRDKEREEKLGLKFGKAAETAATQQEEPDEEEREARNGK